MTKLVRKQEDEQEKKPDLNEVEEQKVEERTSIAAPVVYESIRREGVTELKRSTHQLFWSGLAAGLSMAFSFITQALIAYYLPDAEWTHLISKIGYTIGFLIVILGRQQLFTENTLTVILPLLQQKNISTLLNVLRLWGIVLLANIIGSVILILMITISPVFEPIVHHHLLMIGREALQPNAIKTFWGGILAGYLIAVMVWILPAAQSARFFVILLITYVIGLKGFSHIIAGTSETLYLVFSGDASILQFLHYFFFPTLLGNIVGGVSLVAALGHAQVMAE